MAPRAHIPPENKTQQRTTKQLVLQPRFSTQNYNQEPNNIQQTYTKATFSRSPKPINDKRPTNQDTGRCCHHARTTGSRRKRKSCPLAAPKTRTKNAMDSGVAKVGLASSTVQLFNSSTGDAPPWRDRFCRVFGPENEGDKFSRKRNSSLDASMAKPTPKPLLRMVEREEYLECLGTSVERPV